MDIYRFQTDIDLRYTRHLETQISRYKELLNNNIANSVSENLQNRGNDNRYYDHDNSDRNSSQTLRSLSSPSVQACHDKIVDPHPVNRGVKVGYKVPSINYNTALRSSRRSNRRDLEEEEVSYYRR